MSSTSDESKSVAKVIPGTPTSFSEPPVSLLERTSKIDAVHVSFI